MRDYVEKALHAGIESLPIDGMGLPLYLKGLYSLEQWTVFGVPLVAGAPADNPAVKTLAKHRDALEGALGLPVAFALEGATAYRIERMLEAGMPFIVPGRQVYLPFLGIALSKEGANAGRSRETAVGAVSPQTQRLALMALYGELDGASVTQAADLLGVAKMTASRAFDELEAIDPSLVAAEGRRRVLHPDESKRALWQKLEPHLTSPVAREYRLDHVLEGDFPLSGMSALCDRTMLQDNPWPTIAVTKAQEKELGLASTAGPDDEPACVAQVMRYNIGYENEGASAIDPLSAILSLSAEEKTDPRVESEVAKVESMLLGVRAETPFPSADDAERDLRSDLVSPMSVTY